MGVTGSPGMQVLGWESRSTDPPLRLGGPGCALLNGWLLDRNASLLFWKNQTFQTLCWVFFLSGDIDMTVVKIAFRAPEPSRSGRQRSVRRVGRQFVKKSISRLPPCYNSGTRSIERSEGSEPALEKPSSYKLPQGPTRDHFQSRIFICRASDLSILEPKETHHLGTLSLFAVRCCCNTTQKCNPKCFAEYRTKAEVWFCRCTLCK